MEGIGLVAQGDGGRRVNQDAELWSRLDPGICDMILKKLPPVELLRVRGVCKEWKCIVLQRLEPKPYLVSIVTREYDIKRDYIGLFKYDAVSKSLIIEPLVPIRLMSRYRAVDGLIFCEQPEDENNWCVYNIHNRTKHAVPPTPSGKYISGMMVDTSVKPYTFKLVVSYNCGTLIYNSASRLWSLHPNSNSSVRLPRNNNLFLTLCHKGSMYMSSKYSGGSVFVYSMEENQWTELSGLPRRGHDWPYLGAWDDRFFVVVHDISGVGHGFTGRNVVVWELVDETHREWVVYARCPKAHYEQLMEHAPYLSPYKLDFVSVFCEEYVLMQCWYSCRSYGLVLFNLKSREWESYKVEEGEVYHIR